MIHKRMIRAMNCEPPRGTVEDPGFYAALLDKLQDLASKCDSTQTASALSHGAAGDDDGDLKGTGSFENCKLCPLTTHPLLSYNLTTAKKDMIT